jgi:hypothetical protein
LPKTKKGEGNIVWHHLFIFSTNNRRGTIVFGDEKVIFIPRGCPKSKQNSKARKEPGPKKQKISKNGGLVHHRIVISGFVLSLRKGGNGHR